MAFTAALVQERPEIGDVKANLARVLETLRRERADLVVFPEMFLAGYLPKDGLPHCALAEDGPEIQALAEACAGTGKHLVVGAPMQGRQRGVVTNSALLLGPGGLVGRYDKCYLPTFSVFEEHQYFQPGTGLPVFGTPLGRMGLCICYDLFFPEVTKTLALRGADVIVCVSASPTVSRRFFEAVMPARAIETTSYLLYANLAGAQDHLFFWGGAQAHGPRGDLKARAPYDVPYVLPVEVDLAEVEDARRRRPALRDTRVEVLRGLVDAAGGATESLNG